MKSLSHLLVCAAVALCAASCVNVKSESAGTRIDALDDSAWDQSVWISAPDARVITGRPGDRAADGASCFECAFNNSCRIVGAKWMTSGLGVYDIYVNGKRIGNEVLKPGFTHYEKTKRSFTYDITDVLRV